MGRDAGLGCVGSSQGAFQSSAHPKVGRDYSNPVESVTLYLFQSSAHPKVGRDLFGGQDEDATDLVSILGPPEGGP